MTDQRELDRILGAFFAEGTDELADRVIDAALDQVGRTSQRRAMRVPRKLLAMPMPARLAAVAVIGVVAVGAALFLARPARPVVGGPSPAPGLIASPSAPTSPSAAPSPSVVPPRAPSWTATGSMIEGRGGHTATLLADGTVLVAGSDAGSASAELYHPGSGSWTSAGSMTQRRMAPSAARLPDGKVLVAGGACCGVAAAPLASDELYDPATGSWTPTGSMGTPRGGQTATLLPDGRVLVAGGYSGAEAGGVLASAELYDPGNGTWSPTGSMGTPRAQDTATLLADGKVLVAGGAGTSAELYDPGTGTWSATGSMATARFGHTATLLPDGQVLVAGGWDVNHAVAAAELYDPGTGSWSAAGSMATPRAFHTSTLLPDGSVLVAGGDGPLASAELYDPQSGTWTATASMSTPRAYHTATLLPDGRVLVAGGMTGQPNGRASAELYDPGSPGPSSEVPSATASVVQPKPAMFAYVRSSYHTGQLWIANADGTGAHQLFPDLAGSQGAPSWSPDGRLVFSLTPIGALGDPTGASRLYLTDASGAGPQLVDTGCVAPCMGDSDAAFSNDGTRLVFVRTTSSPNASVLATINLSTGRVAELVSTTVSDASGNFHGYGAADYHPRWSPDGTQIVFTQDVPSETPAPSKGWQAIGPVPALFVVGADGQGLHRIGLPAQAADWSPDGTRIVFGSASLVVIHSLAAPGWLRQYYDIYTVRPDGSDLRRLTSDRFSKDPSWTADGRIRFDRVPMVDGDVNTEKPPQLWIMDADGSNAKQLSVSPLPASLPLSWSPQP